MNAPLRLAPQADLPDRSATPTNDFENLVEAEHGGLYGALCLVTRDRSEAEDLMQEAFLKVWERWDRVGGMEDPTGYLYRTAMNLYRKRRRRASLAVRRTIGVAPRSDGLGQVEVRDEVVRALADSHA